VTLLCSFSTSLANAVPLALVDEITCKEERCDMSLLLIQQHSVLQKGGSERKKHKGNNRSVARLQILSEKLLLFCRFRLFEIFHCADGHALSFGKGGEVKGEGSGVFSSQG